MWPLEAKKGNIGGKVAFYVTSLPPLSETFDTIVSVSKLRYFCPKVSYRYRISIEILYLKSISERIGIEILDIKVSVSVIGITF